MTNRPIRILMICSGNICRSPLAECVLRHKAAQRGFKNLHIDSAGVGDWHVGEAPDHRVRQVAELNGVVMTGAARQITQHDLRHFDWLLCMDQSHFDHLRMLGADDQRTRLLRQFDAQADSHDVPDPYYGGIEGFHSIFTMIDRACDCFLDALANGDGTTDR